MDKLQIIAHAKDYMDLLAQGIDPIQKEPIAADSVVLQARMQKCFAFVAQILDELMTRNGFVALNPQDADRYEIIEKKTPFSLNEEQLRRIPVSPTPITPTAFCNAINRVANGMKMENLSSKSLNAWLLAQEFIKESKEPATIRRTVRRLSEHSSEIGLQEQQRVDAQTGEIKKQLVFSLQTQTYLLAHLNEIAAFSVKRK
jgi:hypothetical protein